MTQTTKIEIEIVDCNKGDWTFKGYAAANARYEAEEHGMIYEDLTIAGVFTCCGVEADIECRNLAEADTRFPQSEIKRIEEEAICRFEGLRLEGCPI